MSTKTESFASWFKRLRKYQAHRKLPSLSKLWPVKKHRDIYIDCMKEKGRCYLDWYTYVMIEELCDVISPDSKGVPKDLMTYVIKNHQAIDAKRTGR